jgi:AcrR family transcriptional regulator
MKMRDHQIEVPHPDLRSLLTYHTFLAVGKSGYARATISRISRRANCSPGAIYKLYPSKEDLIIGAMGSLMEAPWMTISNFAEILDPGVLAQLLYSAASDENLVRKSFALEIAMASAQSNKLRAAVRSQVRRLEAVVPLIDGLDDDDRTRLTCMIRVIIFLTLGVGFLSAITKATDQVDFNEFAEPLRQSLLNNNAPSWVEIQRQLHNLAGPKKTVGTTNA